MNELTRLLQIQIPIIQGGMGNISHAELTAAVSDAGGLGTLGAGMLTPQELEQRVVRTKELTNRPFAVNIPVGMQPYVKDIGKMIIEHRIPVVSLSAGNPSPLIEKLKPHGIKVICVVASVKHAVKAWQAGADALVAEGFEAAGLNASSETTTLVLVPQITDAVDIPVIAAGGIADARGFVAALALGASGVQMGTRLVSTREAVVHDHYKQAIIQSGDTDTVIVGRSYGRPRRILNTGYARKLADWENESMPPEQFLERTDEEHHILGAIKGELEQGHVNCGQVGGLIRDLPSVRELFDQMIREIPAVLKQIGKGADFQ